MRSYIDVDVVRALLSAAGDDGMTSSEMLRAMEVRNTPSNWWELRVAIQHESDVVRVVDGNGVGKWLTTTQYSDERWPHWHPDGTQILYTIGRTTDVFLVDLAR